MDYHKRQAKFYRIAALVSGIASPFVYEYGWHLLGLVLAFVCGISIMFQLSHESDCHDHEL